MWNEQRAWDARAGLSLVAVLSADVWAEAMSRPKHAKHSHPLLLSLLARAMVWFVVVVVVVVLEAFALFVAAHRL